MVDETTGGKPLLGSITFGPAEPEKVTRVSVADMLGTNPERIHVDDARFIRREHPDLAELIAAANECAEDLATALDHEYADRDTYPSYYRKYERDMAPVRRLRAAVARVRGE